MTVTMSTCSSLHSFDIAHFADSVSKVLPALATISVTSIVLLMTLGSRPLSDFLNVPAADTKGAVQPVARHPITAAVPLTILPFVFLSAITTAVLCAAAASDGDCKHALVETIGGILALAVTLLSAMLALAWIVIHHSHRFAGPLRGIRLGFAVAVGCVATSLETLLSAASRAFSLTAPALALRAGVVVLPAVLAGLWQWRIWRRLRSDKNVPYLSPRLIFWSVCAFYLFLVGCAAEVLGLVSRTVATTTLVTPAGLWTIRAATALMLGAVVLLLPYSKWFPDEDEIRKKYYSLPDASAAQSRDALAERSTDGE